MKRLVQGHIVSTNPGLPPEPRLGTTARHLPHGGIGCPAVLVAEERVFLLSCPELPMASPKSLRGSPWETGYPEDKLGPRGAEKAGQPVARPGR